MVFVVGALHPKRLGGGIDLGPCLRCERAVAAVEAATLDDFAARVQVEVMVAALPEARRRQLEALMLSRYEYQSDFARRFFSAGRQEGLQEGLHVGQREVIGRLLRRRFGPAASALISRLESLDGGSLASLADALMDGADLASLEAGLANLRQS
jgi:hypothetical protein